MNRSHTHLSTIELWVVLVFCEEEHVYEVDEYTRSVFRLVRGEGEPLEDHHEHQVTKQTQHEDQLGDQHKEDAAYLTEVPAENRTRQVNKDMTEDQWTPPKKKDHDYLQVVKERQADSKSHVNDTDDDRHLHLVRVQES